MKFLFLPFLTTVIACADSEAKLNTSDSPSESTTTPSTEEVTLPISTKESLSVIAVEADSKYHIWMEGRSGVLRSGINDTFWLSNGGVSISQGSGQYNIEVDGHNYLVAKKNTATPMKEIIAKNTNNNSDFKLVLDMTDKGKYITQIHKPTGRTIKLATSDKKPTATAVIVVKNVTDLYGTHHNLLSTEEKSSALKNGGVPDSGKAITVKAPSQQTLQHWKSDLKSLYGGSSNIAFSTMINLDNDEKEEGFFCATAPSVSKCFVVDTFNGEERYYLSDFNWTPKGNSPVLFSTEHGNYVVHTQNLAKTKVTKVLRFDGSGYTTDRI